MALLTTAKKFVGMEPSMQRFTFYFYEETCRKYLLSFFFFNRFILEETFLIFFRSWRQQNGST
jgi:hypothetical protein